MTFKKQSRIEKQSVGFSEDDIRNLMQASMGLSDDAGITCIDCNPEREIWEVEDGDDWYGLQAKSASGLVFVTIVPQRGNELTTLILDLETDEFIEI